MRGKTLSAPPDPFRFGWRYVFKGGCNGSSEWVRAPLTLDDVLHPQKGDHIPQNSTQARDVRYLADALEWRLADRKDVVVLTDCLVDWGVEGVRNHSPDVAVYEGVSDPQRDWGMMRIVEEGAKCLLTLEVVSPDSEHAQARDNDVVDKFEEYYQVGVPLYVIVDQKKKKAPRHLVGYRHGRKKYVSLTADNHGRMHLVSVGLLIGMRAQRVVCWDDRTGEEIPDLTGMARARQRAEEGRQRAEEGRQRAEEAQAAEALARRQAEEAQAAEALARRQAEEAQAAEALARRQAEEAQTAQVLALRRAQEELATAQARIADLEAQKRKNPGKTRRKKQ